VLGQRDLEIFVRDQASLDQALADLLARQGPLPAKLPMEQRIVVASWPGNGTSEHVRISHSNQL
jgi:hypothetical protein